MTKAELIARCEELGIDHEPLTNNAQRLAAIEAKEAELQAQAKAKELEKKAATEVKEPTTPETTDAPEEKEPDSDSETDNIPEKKEAEPTPKFYEDERGRKWAFKEDAPKSLNIDGHPLTQEEILQDEAIIAELVYGNNSFLKKI